MDEPCWDCIQSEPQDDPMRRCERHRDLETAGEDAPVPEGPTDQPRGREILSGASGSISPEDIHLFQMLIAIASAAKAAIKPEDAVLVGISVGSRIAMMDPATGSKLIDLVVTAAVMGGRTEDEARKVVDTFASWFVKGKVGVDGQN